VQKDLEVHIGELELDLEPGSIEEVGKFITSVFIPTLLYGSAKVPPVVASATPPSLVPAPSASTKEPVTSAQESIPLPPPKPRIPNLSTLQVMAVFGGLKVDLRSRQVSIATLELKGFHFSLDQSLEMLAMDFVMSQIHLTDQTNAGKIWPKFLSTKPDIEGYQGRQRHRASSASAPGGGLAKLETLLSNQNIDPLIRVRYATLSPARQKVLKHCSGELTGHISGLRICFMQRFLLEVLLFFTSGPISSLISSLSAPPPVPSPSSASANQKKPESSPSGKSNAADANTYAGNDSKDEPESIQLQTLSPRPPDVETDVDSRSSVLSQQPSYSTSDDDGDDDGDGDGDDGDDNKVDDDEEKQHPPAFSYMSLDLNLNDLEIIFPKRSYTLEYFMARIDKLKATNSATADRHGDGDHTNDGKLFQRIEVDLENLNIFLGMYNYEELRGQQDVSRRNGSNDASLGYAWSQDKLLPTEIECPHLRPFLKYRPNVVKGAPAMDRIYMLQDVTDFLKIPKGKVEVDLGFNLNIQVNFPEEIKFKFTQAQYALIISLFGSNFFENAVVMNTDGQQSATAAPAPGTEVLVSTLRERLIEESKKMISRSAKESSRRSSRSQSRPKKPVADDAKGAENYDGKSSSTNIIVNLPKVSVYFIMGNGELKQLDKLCKASLEGLNVR
jgi:hypothetical protein